jgi:large subunit ribosomal protein L19e
MVTSLKLQKRLAASILKCGKRKVWLDPLETSDIGLANSRQNVRRLISDGLIMKKPAVIHSRARVRERDLAKRKGRHTGAGKRKGKAGARMPSHVIWVRRIRVLRRMLKKYRATDKIDAHLYHELYLKVKGNVFKNKKNLMEHIHRAKNDLRREKAIVDQAAARRDRNKKRRAAVASIRPVLLAQQAAAAAVPEKAVQKAAGQTKKSKKAAKEAPKGGAAPKAAAKAEKKSEPKKADQKKAEPKKEEKKPAAAAKAAAPAKKEEKKPAAEKKAAAPAKAPAAKAAPKKK